MPRRASHASVKINRPYTVEEAADAVDVTPQTVRRWINENGLTALVSKRPALILGVHLKAFLKARRRSGHGPLAIGKFYCLSCKSRGAPAMGLVQYEPLSPQHGCLVALCGNCEADCSRLVSSRDLPAWGEHCDFGKSNGCQD